MPDFLHVLATKNEIAKQLIWPEGEEEIILVRNYEIKNTRN
jgi:hypothetical protein